MADDGDWRDRKRAWLIGPGLPPVRFDAVIREVHSSQTAITDNPVETGVVITDHAFLLPKGLDIEAGVGDISVHTTGIDDRWSFGTNRSSECLDFLHELQASLTPFNVQTGLKLYENLMISNIGTEQTKKTAGALIFTVSLREVQFVNTETVTFPSRQAGKTARQASKKTDGGEKQAGPVEGPQQLTSILKGILNGGPGSPDVSALVNGLIPGTGASP
jgi:hypothetical protein